MQPALLGRRVLVTGSSRGLGASIARAFADAGAGVAIHYRVDRDAAARVLEGLPCSPPSRHTLVQADLTDSDAIIRLIEKTSEFLGGLDILVNNCGPFGLDSLTDTAPAAWDEILNANVRSTWLTSIAAAPVMREGGWGRVVNLSAGSAFVRNHSVYGLAKAALNVLTEQLAVELAPEITVNALAPGQIAESAPVMEAYDPTFVGRFVAESPLARLVRRDEVAACVVALCTPCFNMLTGAVLPLDGGCRIARF